MSWWERGHTLCLCCDLEKRHWTCVQIPEFKISQIQLAHFHMLFPPLIFWQKTVWELQSPHYGSKSMLQMGRVCFTEAFISEMVSSPLTKQEQLATTGVNVHKRFLLKICILLLRPWKLTHYTNMVLYPQRLHSLGSLREPLQNLSLTCPIHPAWTQSHLPDIPSFAHHLYCSLCLFQL